MKAKSIVKNVGVSERIDSFGGGVGRYVWVEDEKDSPLGELWIDEGADVDEWLDATELAWSNEARDALVHALSEEKHERPDIFDGPPLDRVRDDAVEAVLHANVNPVLFRRGGEVSEVKRNERGVPSVLILTPNRMRDHLGEVADWHKMGQRGPYPVKAPQDVASILLVTPGLHLPPLDAVVEHPVVGVDGKIRVRRGYDPGSATFFAPSRPLGRLDVGPHMAGIGLAVLNDLVQDFEFVDRADRVNWLAFLLTPVLRPVIHGPVPLCAIRAEKAGTGKTLLAKLAMKILLGYVPPASSLTGFDEDEDDKRMTALLQDGEEFLFIDNVPTGTVLKSAALARALTTESWKGRIIRTSKAPTVQVRSTWVATGNGLTMSEEIVRRAYLVQLTSSVENPELRDPSQFQFPDLLGEVEEKRAAYLSAVLSIVDVWLQAGMPTFEGPTLNTYEDWSRVVGSVLAANSVPGFLGNEDRKRDIALDDATLNREALLRALFEWQEETKDARRPNDGWTVSDFHRATRCSPSDDVLEAVAPFMPQGVRWDDPKAVSALGYQLRPLIDNLTAGLVLVQRGRTKRGRSFRVKKA